MDAPRQSHRPPSGTGLLGVCLCPRVCPGDTAKADSMHRRVGRASGTVVLGGTRRVLARLPGPPQSSRAARREPGADMGSKRLRQARACTHGPHLLSVRSSPSRKKRGLRLAVRHVFTCHSHPLTLGVFLPVYLSENHSFGYFCFLLDSPRS